MAWKLPDIDVLIERSHVVQIPLVTPFRGLNYREVMLIEGDQGPGEWAAFTEYSDEEAAWWLASALEQAFDDSLPPMPAGIDDIPVNATFPAIDPSEVPRWWKKFPGARAAKVKVAEKGQVLIDDLARVQAVREAVGPDVSIRLDANGRWDVSDADRAIFMLRAFDIDYIEQPVSTVEEMAKIRQRLAGTGIRVAADELVRKTHSVAEIIEHGAADVIILKVNPLGGVRNALELARQAHEAGLEVVVSSGLETSVGLSRGAYLSSLISEHTGQSHDAGLGTSVFLETDVVTEPLVTKAGRVSTKPVVLDPRKLKKVLAPADRVGWWTSRLSRCLELAQQIGSKP
jgi:O-succinylbenzoate synthase